MTQVSKELTKQFHNFVGSCNAANKLHLHPLDEQRLKEFFLAANAAGLDVSSTLVDELWPENTTEGLGGDPAHSVELRSMVRRIAEAWPNGTN